jgi:hypothetical protein
MSAYLMQEMAAMHEADLRHEAERERLIRQAKAARGQHDHIDFVAVVLNALGLKAGGARPALNPGN